MNLELLGNSTATLAFLPFLIPALIGGAATAIGARSKAKAAERAANQQTQAAAEQAQQQFVFDRETLELQHQYDKERAAQQRIYDEERAKLQYQYDTEAMQQQREWDLEDRQFAIDNPITIKSEIDYEKLVTDAEAAGFNPLTALRSGGGAGFTNTSHPSTPLSRTAPVMQASGSYAPGRTAASRTAPARYTPAPTSGMGEVAGFAADFMQNFDPFKDQQREMEARLVEAQIANLNASSERLNRLGDVPSYTAGNRAQQMGAGVAHGQTFDTLGSALPIPSQPQEIVQPTATNPWPKNWGLTMHPDTVDAGMWEESAGELMGQIIGSPIWAGQQIKHNLERLGGWAIGSIPHEVRDRALNPPPLREILRQGRRNLNSARN